MARKIPGTSITANTLPASAIVSNTITVTQLQTTVVTQIQSGASGGPKISAITYPNSATAVANTGNDSIVLTGTGFESGVTVIVNGNVVPSVTRTNANSLSFTTPALSSTTYPIYVVNPDGGTAIFINPGLRVSGKPNWITTSPLTSWGKSAALSRTLEANSDSAVTYSLAGGSSLPSGLSLAANGLLSGTLTSPPANTTTYNFTVVATDAEGQTTSSAFSINASASITATGGTVTNVGSYRIHTFTSSGSFTVTEGVGEVEYLVVAGGGGGGYAGWGGGGGGAGGLLQGNVSVSTAVYTVTIGAGGAGGGSMYQAGGNPGANSSIIGTGVSIVSVGGGYGSSAHQASNYGSPGGNGGSGGGAAQRNGPVAGGKGIYPGSTYIDGPRQGYDGGALTGGSDSGGGGGGAGGVGQSTSGSGGNGGVGLQSSINGTSTYYAGGGGGGGGSAVGGLGGGGNSGTSGTPNTGGGGGGNNFNHERGSGGSGIVIIRYAV